MLDFYHGKKVFVTGHTGFKGAWLCEILLKAGAKVTGFALESPTHPSLFDQLGLSKRICSIIGDIRDGVRLAAVLAEAEPELVFHLAAQPLVRASYREPVLTYETNVMGTVNVLEAARHTSSVRSAVIVTTDKVYENNEWVWGYRENERLCGFDPYSNSKSCAELVVYSYRNSFFNRKDSPAVSSVRAGNVIGGGDYAEDRIIPDCVRAALAKKPVILRNPASVRPYQHVLDCLSGYLLLAERQFLEKKREGAYNIGPNEDGCVTTGALADMFCRAWGVDTEWHAESFAEAPHEAGLLTLDCAKAKTVLGWEPRWNVQTAVEKTVEFAKLKTDTERKDCVDNQIKDYFER